MNDRLISVVMPCFNAAEHIEASIRSALGQAGVELEIVVVDDGSRDASGSVVASLCGEDARVRLVRQENRGAGPARNRGLREARGQFVAFLDSDDYWAPDCLEKLYRALLSSGCDLTYCGWQNVGLAGGPGQPFVPVDLAKANLVEAFLEGCRWPIHAALVRRGCIDRVGGFDERLTSCMDYDLWLRMAVFVRVALVPEVLAFYRHYEGPRITSNRARIARNQWVVQRRFLAAHPEVGAKLGRRRVRALTHGALLRRGFEAYWARDLMAARALFRLAMRHAYGSLAQWKYMLPALLPLAWHGALVRLADRRAEVR